MAATLYLTLGFPGSGKTHFAVKFAKDQNAFHLNADRLRLEMFDTPTYEPDEHRVVFRTMDYIAEELLAKGISVIYDANMSRKMHREQKYAIAKRHNAGYLLLWFKVPLEVALGRISSRGDGEDKYFRNITPETLHKLKDEIEEPATEQFIDIDGNEPYEQQVEQLIKT